MGVLPLQYPEGENAESLGLTGEETFSITGVTALNDGATPKTVQGEGRRRRVRRGRPHRHPRRGRLLPQRRDHAVRPAEPAQGLSLVLSPLVRPPDARGGFALLSAGRPGGSTTARRPSPARSARARRSGSAGCGWPGARRRRTAAAEGAPGAGAELESAVVAVAGGDVPAAAGLAGREPVPGPAGGVGGGGASTGWSSAVAARARAGRAKRDVRSA